MVLTEIEPPRMVCHRVFPLSASKAKNRRFKSPQNTKPPAVVTTEPLVWERPIYNCLISPVDMSIFATPAVLSGVDFGLGTGTRLPLLPLLRPIFRQLSL